MKSILTIICVASFIWSVPFISSVPAAAKTYSLTVSVHKGVAPLRRSEVKAILQRASRIMHNARCNVTFKLDGHIKQFDLPGGNEITDPTQRDAVHAVEANVKIVDTIGFCPADGVFRGCAFPVDQPGNRPGISIILTRNEASLANRWAHEVGHRMGLPHRPGLDKKPLMTACAVESQSVELSPEECNCFLQGPLSCGTPQVIRCPH